METGIGTEFEFGFPNLEVSTAFSRVLAKGFSEIPYDITVKSEKYYQSLMFFILKMLGSEVDAEVRNHIGRMDCLVRTRNFIYVIEFKLNGTAEEALQQIEAKQYARPYVNDPRKLFEIGVEFCAEKRNISRWLIRG